MKIPCPTCHVPVLAEDVDLASGMAKCRTCNSVFRIADAAPELARPAVAGRPAIATPRSVAIAENAGTLVIRYRWFSPKYVFMAFFCVFWVGFLVVWYALVFGGHAPLLFKLFPILHVAVGVVMVYSTAAGFLNSTTLTIDPDRLRVASGPVPWGKGNEVQITDVRQLFCEQIVTQGRYGPSYSYTLDALMKDGTRLKLIPARDAPELPIFLEQHAEQWLRIPDQAVAGELAR